MQQVRLEMTIKLAKTYCFLAAIMESNYYLGRARSTLEFVRIDYKKQDFDEITDVLEFKEAA